MKNKVKTIAIGAFSLVLVACVSQNSQASSLKQNSSVHQRGNQQRTPPTFSELLEKMDANEDGKLSKSEIKGPLANNFSEVDTNEDGFISESEFKNAPKPQRGGQRQ